MPFIILLGLIVLFIIAITLLFTVLKFIAFVIFWIIVIIIILNIFFLLGKKQNGKGFYDHIKKETKIVKEKKFKEEFVVSDVKEVEKEDEK